MNDMSRVITPKSDQLNSDDLLTGPKTIKITGVTIKGGQDQPISIHYEGDNGKPYKACKSMCRVMVAAWGADSSKYAGRSMTLYNDPKVRWAGMEVGGIRISHMSHIENTLTMALTVTKGNKKPYVIKPLQVSNKPEEKPIAKPSVEGTVDAISEIFNVDIKKSAETIQSITDKLNKLIIDNEDTIPVTWQEAARDKMNDPEITVEALVNVYNKISDKVKS